MTNNRIKHSLRWIACLMAVLILFSSGAGSVVCAFAEGEGGDPPASFTPPAVSYDPVMEPIDLDKDCELTVYPCGQEASEAFKTDINSAEMTMDLYRIASAASITGVDSYNYTLLSVFNTAEMESLLLETRTKAEDVSTNKAKWDEFAQAAAAIIKNSGSGGNPVQPYLTATKAAGGESVQIQGTETVRFLPGLYLIVPHTDASDYWKAQTSTSDPILSTTYSDSYYYYYKPTLVSMPYKREAIPTTNEPVMTSDKFGWYYGLNVYLKPEQVQRYADLWIKKTLYDYHVDSDAIFVFYVDVIDENGDILLDQNGDPVYSKSFSVLFEAGEVNHKADSEANGDVKFTVAKNVPLGKTVKVTEVYQGSSCEPVGTTVYTGTMTENGLKISEAQTLQPVPFVNKGNGSNGGGGIENTYTYGPTQSGGDAWDNGSPNATPGQNTMPDTQSGGTQGS